MNQFIKVNTPYRDVKLNEVGMVENDHDNSYKIKFANGACLDIPKSDCSKINIKETMNSDKYKICNVCGRYLPIENFEKNQNGKNNRVIRRPTCRECRKVINGKDIPSADRKEWNKIKPDFEVWTCPICHKTTIAGVTAKVVLDHNHHTGKPRAWICDSCNTGLGRFKDDIQILKNAIEYLKKDESKY